MSGVQIFDLPQSRFLSRPDVGAILSNEFSPMDYASSITVQ